MTSNMDETYLHDRFAQMQQAFLTQPQITLKARLNALAKIKQQLIKHKMLLCHKVEKDFSVRSATETQLAELIPILETIRYVRNRLKYWIRPTRRQVSWLLQPAKAWIEYQPLGVVGIMSPWNYPIQLTLIPLIYALAAGNRVFIKTSEYAPHTAQALEKLLSEIFPPDQVAMIHGAADVGQAFASLPFNHLFFTGSTRTGQKIMAAAAQHLTPVTLELGGKSPAIIGTDANIEAACEAIIFGKGFNAGQTCIAPDILFCATGQYPSVCKALTSAAQKLYPDWKNNADYSAIIHSHHLARLDHLLADAKQKDAHIMPLTAQTEDFTDSQKRPITLLSNVRSDMLIAQEEIFGPWLILMTYDTLDDAIAYVNQGPCPLALYYFGHKESDIQRIIRETRSGGVCVNDMLAHVAATDLPFGGIGASGMGQYHGIEGFLTFSHEKPILRKGMLNPTRWFYPPWNRFMHRLLFKRYF